MFRWLILMAVALPLPVFAIHPFPPELAHLLETPAEDKGFANGTDSPTSMPDIPVPPPDIPKPPTVETPDTSTKTCPIGITTGNRSWDGIRYGDAPYVCARNCMYRMNEIALCLTSTGQCVGSFLSTGETCAESDGLKYGGDPAHINEPKPSPVDIDDQNGDGIPDQLTITDGSEVKLYCTNNSNCEHVVRNWIKNAMDDNAENYVKSINMLTKKVLSMVVDSKQYQHRFDFIDRGYRRLDKTMLDMQRYIKSMHQQFNEQNIKESILNSEQNIKDKIQEEVNQLDFELTKLQSRSSSLDSKMRTLLDRTAVQRIYTQQHDSKLSQILHKMDELRAIGGGSTGENVTVDNTEVLNAIKGLEGNLLGLDGSLAWLSTELNGVGGKLDGVNGKLEGLNGLLSGEGLSPAQIGSTIEYTDLPLYELDELTKMETEVDNLKTQYRQKIDEFKNVFKFDPSRLDNGDYKSHDLELMINGQSRTFKSSVLPSLIDNAGILSSIILFMAALAGIRMIMNGGR